MSWGRKSNEKTEHGYVSERLSAYLDGELTQQERGIVERHLATCQDCRWNFNTLRQTVQWVQELPSVPVPRVFTIPVPAQRARATRRRWGVPLLQGATALVALMLVFVVAGDFVLTRSWLPAAREVGLPLAAPGDSEAAPTVAAESDTAVQVVAETLQVEITKQVEMEVETVVEKVAVEEAAPAATVLESPPAEPAEAPAPEAVPSTIAERVLEVKATLEAAAGESPTIVEAQTAIAQVREGQAATMAPEPTVIPTETSAPPPLPTPTAIPTGMPTPSPEEPLAVEAPTTVAVAPSEEPRAGGQEGVRTEDWVEPAPAAVHDRAETARLPRDPLIVWFGMTELSLTAVLILLATITIVVMIRQRRTR